MDIGDLSMNLSGSNIGILFPRMDSTSEHFSCEPTEWKGENLELLHKPGWNQNLWDCLLLEPTPSMPIPSGAFKNNEHT